MPNPVTNTFSVRRHRGDASGISFVLSTPLQAPLYLSEIYVYNSATLTGVEGEIDDGTGATDPGRVDADVYPHRYADILVLAALSNTVKLSVTITYDPSTSPKRVLDITCRRADAGLASNPAAAE